MAFIPAIPCSVFKRLGFLLGGIIVASFVMLITGVQLVPYVRTVSEVILNPSAQQASGYTVTTLLIDYMNSINVTVRALAIPVVLTAFLLIVNRGGGSRKKAHTRSSAVLERLSLIFTALLALILLLPRPEKLWDDLGAGTAFMACVTVLAVSVIWFRPQPTESDEDAGPGPRRHLVKAGQMSPVVVGIALFVFAAAPFISAVGTNNPIVGQIVFSATLWAVGLGISLAIAWERTRARSQAARMIPLLIAVIVMVNSGLAVASDVFIHPYNTDPYLKQHSAVSLRDLRGLRVTASEAALFDWLKDVGVREKARGVPTVSIGSPGELFAFNASGWANPWITQYTYSSISRACEGERPKGLFVLQPGSTGLPFEGFRTALAQCVNIFPDDFTLIDQRIDADPGLSVRVWKMKP